MQDGGSPQNHKETDWGKSSHPHTCAFHEFGGDLTLIFSSHLAWSNAASVAHLVRVSLATLKWDWQFHFRQVGMLADTELRVGAGSMRLVHRQYKDKPITVPAAGSHGFFKMRCHRIYIHTGCLCVFVCVCLAG